MPRRGTLARLWSSRLLVVTGKGGVGKSTLAVALGRLLAARGRRVLLLETDPREHLHRFLGTAPSGGERVTAGEGLSHLNLRPRLVLEDLVRERVPVPLLARAALSSPVFDHFVEGAPGLKEMAILGYAYRATEDRGEHAVDVVVLDAPATGHGASMLAAPELVAGVLPGGPIGDLARELADFVSDPKRCAVVVATVAEEMPIQEALELIAMLGDRVGPLPELVAVNALYPSLPASPPRSAAAGKAFDLWRHRRELNERELERLTTKWTGPLITLPLLPIDNGPDLVAALCARMDAELGRIERRT